MTLKSKKDVDFNSTKDPYAQREAEKYENPIPSRELILQFIEHAGKPLRREEIAAAFSLETEDQLEALRRRLRAMERDGQLLFNRGKKYCLVNNEDLIAGRIIGHADGFGFIKPDDIAYVDGAETKKEIGIEIHSGRNRIVRRIFESLGYNVVKLDRVLYATLTKKSLSRGKWRFLSEGEVRMLKKVK